MFEIEPKVNEFVCFDDRLVRLIGIPILAVLVQIVAFNASLYDIFLSNYGLEFLEGLVYTAAYWEGGRWAVTQVRKRLPDPGKTLRRNIIQLFVVSINAILISLVVGTFFWCFSPTAQVSIRSGITAGITASYIIIGFYEIAYIYYHWHQAQLEKEQYKKDAIQAQLHGLRAQVNPHFLFNSLNSLIYLIPENQKKAVHFVQKLSNVYRYILDTRDTELIPLREELQFLEAFRFLLEVRFEENLRVELAIEEDRLDHLILPLSLQLLFENAIKHNIISDAQPLTISVTTKGDFLEMRNKLQKKITPLESTGTGLENVRRRYLFFTPKEIEVIETQEAFIVRLPLLKAVD